MESEKIKEHKKSGWGVPIAHTCKDGDMESTANCSACKWLREKMNAEKIKVALMDIETDYCFRHEEMTREEMDKENRFFRSWQDPWRYIISEGEKEANQ